MTSQYLIMTISSGKGTYTQCNVGQLIMMKVQREAERAWMTEHGALHNFRVLHVWDKPPLSLVTYRKKQVFPPPEDVNGGLGTQRGSVTVLSLQVLAQDLPQGRLYCLCQTEARLQTIVARTEV